MKSVRDRLETTKSQRKKHQSTQTVSGNNKSKTTVVTFFEFIRFNWLDLSWRKRRFLWIFGSFQGWNLSTIYEGRGDTLNVLLKCLSLF